MPPALKKGTKILVVEGPQQGAKGFVTQVQRVYDEEAKTKRWTVWADDIEGGERIKTRLAWVREI
jgi:hypothetical protein